MTNSKLKSRSRCGILRLFAAKKGGWGIPGKPPGEEDRYDVYTQFWRFLNLKSTKSAPFCPGARAGATLPDRAASLAHSHGVPCVSRKVIVNPIPHGCGILP